MSDTLYISKSPSSSSSCMTCPLCKGTGVLDDDDNKDEIYDSSSSEGGECTNENKDNDSIKKRNASDEDIYHMVAYLMDYIYDDCMDVLMEYHYREKWIMIIEKTFDEILSIDDSLLSLSNDDETLESYQEEIKYLLLNQIELYILDRQNKHIFKSLYKPEELKRVENQLERIHIKNESLPEQRTEGWYNMRHNMISASSLWKCLHTESAKRQLIKEKCEPVKKFFSVNMDSALHWGQKYEPLAQAYYEYKYNTTIKEYGCIQHDAYVFLGASPDGINVDPSSSLYGRMLEIKCIVNRDITGIPKKEYWIQMQLQMECCNLDSCDFLECRFKEYESLALFEQDEGNEYMRNRRGEIRGTFICFMNELNNPFYVYPPISLSSKEDYDKWEEETMNRYSHLTWLKNIYWYLEYVSCVTVKRNMEWFEKMLPRIKDVWNEIESKRQEKCQEISVEKMDHTNLPKRSPSIKPRSNIPSKILFDLDTTDL